MSLMATTTLFLTILLNLLQLAESENYMAIVWGQPQPGEPTIYANITSWSACVQLCYEANNCVVAYNRGYNASTEGCEIYEYFLIDYVNRYTAETALGAKVAFKLSNYDNGTGCQNGTKPPTFANNFAYGEVENPARPALKPGYNVTLSNGVWRIRFDGNKYCPEMSFMSVRPGGAVCLSYYYTTGSMNRTYGKSLCTKKNNGQITGIDNMDEFGTVRSVFMGDDDDIVWDERVIWLDGERRKACQGSDWKTLPGCEGLKAFRFSDPFQSNTDLYEWVGGAPVGKGCLVMWAHSIAKPALVGKIQDIDCDAACTKAMCATYIPCWLPPN